MRLTSMGVAAAITLLAVPPAALQAQEPLPDGVTEEMVEMGSQVFSLGGLSGGNCIACHGEEGAGTALAPALNDDEWLHIDGSYEAIVGIVTSGVTEPKEAMLPMAARGGSTISDEQVAAVAAYVWRISHGN